jgi:hypothetical protein
MFSNAHIAYARLSAFRFVDAVELIFAIDTSTNSVVEAAIRQVYSTRKIAIIRKTFAVG